VAIGHLETVNLTSIGANGDLAIGNAVVAKPANSTAALSTV